MQFNELPNYALVPSNPTYKFNRIQARSYPISKCVLSAYLQVFT
jgi:hypothetical protein